MGMRFQPVKCNGANNKEMDKKDTCFIYCGGTVLENLESIKNKKISNDQELIQSDPISCPQNQKGNN